MAPFDSIYEWHMYHCQYPPKHDKVYAMALVHRDDIAKPYGVLTEFGRRGTILLRNETWYENKSRAERDYGSLQSKRIDHGYELVGGVGLKISSRLGLLLHSWQGTSAIWRIANDFQTSHDWIVDPKLKKLNTVDAAVGRINATTYNEALEAARQIGKG